LIPVDNTNKTESLDEAVSVQKALADSWLEQNPSFPRDHVHVVGTIEDAVDFAVNRSKQVSSETSVQVLTTGSLIMVGNTLTVLGMEPQ
jgi:folylpolyglutamate synthase